MVSRLVLNQLTDSQAQLSAMAKRDLRDLFASLPSDPYLARDLLLENVPIIAAEYGDLSASVAMEWFEDAYDLPSAIGSEYDRKAIEGTVRRTAGGLFEGNPELVIAGIQKGVDVWVKHLGRDSLMQSCQRNGLRYARVPSGPRTCAWCLMLASRGAVYLSEDTAAGKQYHGGNCDCEPMPVRPGEELPGGYDVDEMHSMYQRARAASGSDDPKDITYEMRRMFPDALKDGVHEH